MGKIQNAYIFPHAPILISQIGKDRTLAAKKTVLSCQKAAREIFEVSPDTIIISTPHAPCFSDYVVISDSKSLKGNFTNFGEPDINMDFENNIKLAEKISEYAVFESLKAGFLTKSQKNLYGISDLMDHGAAVPLYFINEEFKKHNKKFSVVSISTPFLSLHELFYFGGIIRKAVENYDGNIVYLASGDLSHRLTVSAPAGYSPEGAIYDKRIVELIKSANYDKLLDTDPESMEKAGECGTRSFAIMFGAMAKDKLKGEVYSYEGPFGVGYMVAKISANGSEQELVTHKKENKMSEHAILAFNAIKKYIRTGEIISVPTGTSKFLSTEGKGCFVSLKKNGELRGCIGTIFPSKDNLAQEIISNAISAAFRDYRFSAVKEDELEDITISVDVLSQPSIVRSEEELDEKVYGVIVSRGNRRGLLLPNLEGVTNPRQQIHIALHKAGISPDEDYSIEKFKVDRFY